METKGIVSFSTDCKILRRPGMGGREVFNVLTCVSIILLHSNEMHNEVVGSSPTNLGDALEWAEDIKFEFSKVKKNLQIRLPRRF